MSTIEFNQQFNQMSNYLRAFAYNLTKNVDDSRDLFQETAFRALTKYNIISTNRMWHKSGMLKYMWKIEPMKDEMLQTLV